MILKLLPLTITRIALTLPIISSPLPLGIYVLLISIITTLIICSLASSWLAIITFLIYIGGMLVLFSYFLAIQPNQLITIRTFTITSMISLLLLIINTSKFHTPQLIIIKTIIPSIPFIISNYNLSFIIVIALILLFILVVVVKITTSLSGPLRPFF